ncbi:hypothetical protein SAMN04487890_103344 [Mucilaginibacter polytrichastri]|nr:hypothetical protein SAMN04487890_103344 [Mucilaginibacter polytrichastri]
MAIRIVMAILILYLLLNVLVIAFFMDKIIDKAMPDEDMIPAFCSILLYYYLFDLLMRLQLQELPTLRVQPYLTLPVKRNTLVGYLSFTAILSVFNLWPLILFTPFALKIIAHENGAGVAAVFILAVAALTVFNNYLALYIKRKSNLNGWIFLAAAAALILISTADFSWHLYSIRKASGFLFGHLLAQPAFVVLPILLGAVMYYLNFLYLKGNLYLEELGSRKASAYKSSTEIPLLGYFGHIGDLVANEIKLILRNKRPRSSLVMSLLFMFYGLIFYTNPAYQNSPAIKLLPAILMTGIFIINYGQFMFSWQGGHFDGILVSKVTIRDFFKAKYLLFSLVSTLVFILTIPYVYYGWHILFIHFIMYLWNMGVNATIVLFFANRNYRRIDLSKGASFNWEGVGATQLLLALPLMLGPYLIYWPLSFFKHPDVALIILGLTGLLFILTRSFWIKQLEKDFITKRYTIAEGFRAK